MTLALDTLPAPTVSVTARRAVLAGAVAAPILFVAGQALFPSLPREFEDAFPLMLQMRDLMFAGRAITAVGALLFLLIGGPLGFLVPGGTRGSLLLRVGLVLAGSGTLANAVSQLVQAYALEASTDPKVLPGAGAAVLLNVADGPEGMPIGYWTVVLFASGLLLIAVALLISRRIGVTLPVVLLIGLVAAFASAGLGPVVAVTMAPFAVALVMVLLTAGRRGYGRRLHSGPR